MSKIIATDLNLSQNQLLNVLAHVNSTDVGSPVAGQFYYNSASKVMKFYNGTGWVVLGNIGDMDAAIADVEMGGFNITGLPATPSGTTAAASKAYVDSVCEGLDVKTACRVATTANLASLATLLTIDGKVLVAGDRVLVKDQTAQATNGIYVAAVGSWARATDCDSWEDLFAAYTVITEGDTLAGTSWVCTIKLGGTLGSTDVTFSQFSAASTITASNLGVTTYGVFKSKVGNDLQFRSLTATSVAIVLANNTNDVGIDVSANLKGLHSNTTVGLVAQTVSGTTYVGRTLTAPAAGITVTNGNGVSGNPTLVLANDLAGVEGLTTNGIAVRTGDGTWTTRSIAETGSTLTITNADGVAGNPSIAVAAKIEGLTTNSTAGFLANPASTATPVSRTITGTSPVTVTNGDGAAGNPTIALDASVLHDTTKFSKYYQGTFTFVSTGTTISVTHNLALVTPFIPTFNIFESTSKAQVEVEIVSATCTTNVFAFKMTGTGFSTTAGYYSIQLVG